MLDTQPNKLPTVLSGHDPDLEGSECDCFQPWEPLDETDEERWALSWGCDVVCPPPHRRHQATPVSVKSQHPIAVTCQVHTDLLQVKLKDIFFKLLDLQLILFKISDMNVKQETVRRFAEPMRSRSLAKIVTQMSCLPPSMEENSDFCNIVIYYFQEHNSLK